MTTTKESPDSGAGADRRWPELWTAAWDVLTAWETHDVAGIAEKVEAMRVKLGAIDDPDYPAQDSGQGEAVAYIMQMPGNPNDAHLCWRNQRSPYLHDGYQAVPLFPHPPKPAQDAAGKGVDAEALELADWMDRNTYPNDRHKRIAELLRNHAKPAQVGEKYPNATTVAALRSAEKLEGERFASADQLFAANDADLAITLLGQSDWYQAGNMNAESLMDVLSRIRTAIGAVVPARDGGV